MDKQYTRIEGNLCGYLRIIPSKPNIVDDHWRFLGIQITPDQLKCTRTKQDPGVCFSPPSTWIQEAINLLMYYSITSSSHSIDLLSHS
jgi:hypothetical protein